MVNYIPNHIPLKKRAKNIAISFALLIYGGFGIYRNDLWIPGKVKGMHFKDELALILYASFICGSLVMLSEVLDHYDRKNNEHKYRKFADFFGMAGLFLLVVAMVYFLFREFKA